MRTKKERFVELKEKRLARAMTHLDLLSNLSTHRYDFTEEEADQLLETLNNKVKYVEGLFKRRLEVKAKRVKKVVGISRQAAEEESKIAT
ncbi:hypothetical protein [Viridibacillus soli]|uniref:hypothetical protein n=1 Tax=Viridibacillus soli TaxID=2798301 RepID=UPI001F1E6079|nr:hypothetical protein [Viridibacillus soli]